MHFDIHMDLKARVYLGRRLGRVHLRAPTGSAVGHTIALRHPLNGTDLQTVFVIYFYVICEL